MMKKIEPVVDHIGIVVPELQPAIEMYEAIGYDVLYIDTMHYFSVAMLASKAQQYGTDFPNIELICKYKNFELANHIAFKTESFNAALEEFVESGAVCKGLPDLGRAGKRFVFMDVAGSLVELVEH